MKHIGKENDTYIIKERTEEVYSDGKALYVCQCKLCGKHHLRTWTAFRTQTRYKTCSQYRQHNWKGLSREDQRLQRLYGVTMDYYNQKLEEQGGVCVICKISPDSEKKRFHIDHCHTTGKVRGILCSNCNTALGSFRDNVESLNRAIEYLGEYNDIQK